MPEISKYLKYAYNLKVELRGGDHNPPHIHVTNKKYNINWMIGLDYRLLGGKIITKQQRNLYKVVLAWMSENINELMDLWISMQNNSDIWFID